VLMSLARTVIALQRSVITILRDASVAKHERTRAFAGQGSTNDWLAALSDQLLNPLPVLPPAVSRPQPARSPTRRPRRLTESEVDELVGSGPKGFLFVSVRNRAQEN
jgi:hypothetical protein